ncbi:MAG: hypothetical protein SVR04_06870 [Spirochaetota bacterium]|nr:hypothetical protein [Spirochaetota bacterium]
MKKENLQKTIDLRRELHRHPGRLQSLSPEYRSAGIFGGSDFFTTISARDLTRLMQKDQPELDLDSEAIIVSS